MLLAGILGSLLFSIFFSGLEMAFLSANKVQLELLGKRGTIAGRIMSFFLQRPTWFIGTTLVGNIASLLCFGILTTQAIVPVFQTWFPTFTGSVIVPVILFTIVFTLLVLYTVEFISKSFFIINSSRMVIWLAIPFAVVSIGLFPVVYLIISIAKLLSMSLLKLEYSMDKPVFGLTDVDQYLKTMERGKQSEQNLELDTKIYTNALEFRTVRVRDCMIPRTEIVAVAIDAGIKKLNEAFIESGHSKIVIYKESIDDVIGYCHSSALFKQPSKIEEILTPILTVPEAMMARELMIRFINERKSLAIVIDEFGGTSGIVSMEDVIEEIFGDIEDEHDQDDLIEQKLDDQTYLLSARLEIDYLNETYGWNLPVGDYETISGLILSVTEGIPKQGDSVPIPPFTFIIHATTHNRIHTVSLKLPDKTAGY